MRISLVTAATLALTALPALAQDDAPMPPAGWFESPAKLTQTGGAEIYGAICVACHMPDGQGAIGAGEYPALAGNENLLAADYPVYVILNGLRAMPSLAPVLDDAQISEVVNYVRTSFGNDYTDEPATAQSVAEARQ